MNLTDFSELWDAVNKIKIDKITTTELALFEEEGLKTDLSDVYPSSGGELVTILNDGSIRKTIVHICDIREYMGSYTLPKYHILECTTLTGMRANKREHRYKKASRCDGKFWVIEGEKRNYKELKVCTNCLNQYNRFYSSNDTVYNFDIKSYIQHPIKHLEPYITSKYDMTEYPKCYAHYWQEISKNAKVNCNWTCQECSCDLSENRKYLHTHHIDADISNNDPENLKVLCIECHAKEYQHDHIKATPLYKEFVKNKRELCKPTENG